MVSAGNLTETGLAVASGAHAIRDISYWPSGTPDRSNSAWPERRMTTGSWGFQPGPSGRRIRVTACSTVPGRAPPTVRTTRTGAISSGGRSAASAPPVTTSTVLFASVIAALSMRSQLRIDSAAITDANSTVDVVTGGALAADLPPELIAPVRVVLTVGGARPGTVLHAVTRILRPDGPGWNPQGPLVVRRSGQAEFDLSGVPDGQYEMSLIAWAPDATAKPVSVRLPALTIRSASG